MKQMMFKTQMMLGLFFFILLFENSAATPPPLLPDTCSDYVCLKRTYKKNNGSYVETVSKLIHSDENNIRFLFEYDDNSRELISMSFPSPIEGLAESWEQSSYTLNMIHDGVNPTFSVCRPNASGKECIFISYWSFKGPKTVDVSPCPFPSIWIKPSVTDVNFPIGTLLIEARVKQGVCTYRAQGLSN